ncbi:MAG TPA: zinc-dependent metalloprotease [Acidimicrobiia bacterium]|nr:zinc-dependent metalloprotease [Acidimicrobiia bacterium]
MTDNLFDRLADLFRSPGPVNWRLAREIAESAAGVAEPVDPWLDEEYRDLSATAVRYVDGASPLDPVSAAEAPRILDRRAWAGDATESLAYIAEPLAAKLGNFGPGAEMAQMLAPALIGLQMGGMIGALSHRVMGGFDLGLPPGRVATPAYLVPNIEDFAGEHDLDRRQVRLWAAMHETTHVAAMAVPWVRQHAIAAMTSFVESLEVDEEAIAERMAVLQDPEALQKMVEGGAGMPPLLAARGGDQHLTDARTLMAIAAGYADFLIDRNLSDLLPGVAAVREAIDRRRIEPSPGEVMLSQMIGMQPDPGSERRGHDFCLEVGRRWGDEAVHRLWDGPATLPRAGDLEDPVAWAARALL